MHHDPPPATVPRVVVLTPVYNEEDNLSEFEKRIGDTLFSYPDYDVRILLIDDGSSDGSWRIVKEMAGRDPRVSGLRLSRNYGAHTALSAGFLNAEGDCVCTLACDLQDPPEVIREFLEKWQAGAKIVWGKRRSRGDSGWRVLCSRLFFSLVRRFAMPKGSKFTTGSFLLADRKVVECFRQFKEQNRVTFALMAWTGFNQDVVEYDRQTRTAGRSAWTFPRMMKAMYDTFVGFSFAPIKLMTTIGICVSIIALLLMLYIGVVWIVRDSVLGWASVMVTMSFFFGLQFLLMGLVGEYLYRIYLESVRRPLFFVSETTLGNDLQILGKSDPQR